MVTPKDVLFKLVALGLPADATPISHVMTPSPDVMPSSATVEQALLQLQYGGCRTVPVVSAAGAPIGILDVLQLLDAHLGPARANPARRPGGSADASTRASAAPRAEPGAATEPEPAAPPVAVPPPPGVTPGSTPGEPPPKPPLLYSPSGLVRVARVRESVRAMGAAVCSAWKEIATAAVAAALAATAIVAARRAMRGIRLVARY